jgi:hypothetical protein
MARYYGRDGERFFEVSDQYSRFSALVRVSWSFQCPEHHSVSSTTFISMIP